MQKTREIPNNVDLSADRQLERALLSWQNRYLDWWREVGPEGFHSAEVYLRTAISVEPGGWAHFRHVRMPDYRWGIFLAPPVAGRTIGCGEHCGRPVWQEVPADYKDMLWRLLTVQADTEPGSVEMQRLLGKTAPSLYDLRNLFQVNVEEGRHLWAIVYLLHKYFRAQGVEESFELLRRRSGCVEKPRILGTFNQPIANWLDFFMFTMFGDRDGKYQLASLAESGFDPLARTCQFMLTEEAHHLFVGETGVGRVVARTAELMQSGVDVCAAGGIPIDLIQRSINYWYSCCLDLFGGEISRNAGEYFTSGLKPRFREVRQTDHFCNSAVYSLSVLNNGTLVNREVPLCHALNEILRDEYERDCQRAVDRWNRILREHGQSATLRLSHRRFNRRVGVYSQARFNPSGELIALEEWEARQSGWLPTQADRQHVEHLMRPVFETGKIAGWIAPPERGIKGKPFAYEYVRF